MSDITTFSELVDKLITINIKLYNVMEVTGTLANKENRRSETSTLPAIVYSYLRKKVTQ